MISHPMNGVRIRRRHDQQIDQVVAQVPAISDLLGMEYADGDCLYHGVPASLAI